MRATRFSGRIAQRHRHACRLLACLVAGLALSACGATTDTATAADTLRSLRTRAVGAPHDPALQSTLLLSEMFASTGDAAAVDAQLERALALAPDDVRLRFAAGVHLDAHGHPAEALPHYLKVLELATDARDRLAPQLAELAALAIEGSAGAVVDYDTRVAEAGYAVFRRRALPAPAQYALGNLLIDLAYRRGDRAEAQTVARSLGCLTHLRAAGPFGPRELLGFDRQPRDTEMAGQTLADRYDLGFDRGVRPTRVLGARGCTVAVGGGAVAEGGTTYAEGYLDVASSGDYLVRLESPNSIELFVDGQSVERIDRRTKPLPAVHYLVLPLPRGRHRLTAKVVSRHPNPTLALSVRAPGERDRAAIALPFRPDTRAGFGLYLNAGTQLARGDVVGARRTLRGVTHAEHASPLLMLQRAGVFLGDALVPGEVRHDEARRLFAAALKRDPELWHPTLQLARMAADNGREKEAIEALREAIVRFPDVPAIGLTLASLLQDQGWNHEAERVIGAVRARVPDACAPLEAELDALRARDRERQARALTAAIMRCNAQSNARYAMLLRMRRWEDARDELERLAAMVPPQERYAWTLARLELAKNRGDDAEIARQIALLRTHQPQSMTGALEQVDWLAGRGDVKAALEALTNALEAEPAWLAGLHRLAPLLGGHDVLEPYRRDGAEAIHRFEASGHTYAEPQVLVFDYMAIRIFPDGSSMELVHTIQKVQSDEAVDELAEVHVPDGARILTLRTVKADGRCLEPDHIAGKDAISLPDVKPGDYVEFEYRRDLGPSEGFPGGYLGDRFYFKSFEVPFDHSQMVVVLPAELDYVLDPRGAAPAPVERREGGLRVLDFTVEESKPLTTERGSVHAREYIPSIRIGVKATWPAFVESINDVLADRDIRDPDLALLVKSIVGDAANARARAQKLYTWVLENIENSDDTFSQAAAMLRARSGNRTRILHYLLTLAGVPSQLALVRSVAADATDSPVADEDTFEHLLVTFGKGEQRVWLFTVERWAPFGYVPPALRGQPALLLEAGAPRLTVPKTTPGSELRRLVVDIHMSRGGAARVDVVETVHGTGAAAWRGNLESIPEAELHHRFNEEYVARLFPGATLASVDIEGADEVSSSITLRYSFDVDVLGRRVARGWALPSMLAAKLSTNYASLASRTTDLLMTSPLETDVVLRVHLPSGAARPEPPAEVRLEAAVNGRPSFVRTARYEGDALIIERKTRLPKTRIPPEQYPAFAAFCQRVDAQEAKEIVYGLP